MWSNGNDRYNKNINSNNDGAPTKINNNYFCTHWMQKKRKIIHENDDIPGGIIIDETNDVDNS